MPASLSLSKNVRQAAEQTHRAHRPDSSPMPSRNASLGSSQRRSSSADTCWATDAASLARDWPGGSVSGDPSPHPHLLAQRPERDPVAVRRASATVPPDGLGQPVDILQQAPRRAVTCRSRRSRSPTQHAPGPRGRCVQRARTGIRTSSARPTNGGSTTIRVHTEPLGHHAQGAPGTDELRLAPSASARRRSRTRSHRTPLGRSPHRPARTQVRCRLRPRRGD